MKETNILQPTPVNPSKFSQIVSFAWDFSKIILIALAIIVPIRYYLFQPFIVSGSSMEPNFSNGEYLIIDEISYRFREPVRGEVLVIKFPDDTKQFFIKRVVGLPGEQVKIDDGVVSIFNQDNPNGIIVEESYLPNQGLTFPHNTEVIGGKNVLSLGENEYFMLGDNRLGSSDSRDWGVLDTEGVVGKVFMRALPFSEFGLFQIPEYNL